MSDLQKLCGLWSRTSKSGTEYLSGKVQEDVTVPAGAYVQVFANDRRDSDKHPEFNITYSLPEGSAPPPPKKEGSAFDKMRGPSGGAKAAKDDEEFDDNVPF